MRSGNSKLQHERFKPNWQQGGTEALARIGCSLKAMFTLAEIKRLTRISLVKEQAIGRPGDVPGLWIGGHLALEGVA